MPDQPLPQPGKTDVTESLIALLRERQQKGIETYGTSLFTFNGRDSTRDLVEELVDAAQYALQWQIERADLLAELDYCRPIVAAAREWRDAKAASVSANPWTIELDRAWTAARDNLLAALGEE